MKDEEKSREQLIQELEELRKRVAELDQEQTLLHNLMDHISDAIYFKDRDSRFLRISKALAGWYGIDSPDDAIGKTDFDFFPGEFAQKAREDELKVIETGSPLESLREQETWPDGRETWVSTTKVPLHDADENLIGTFGISRDITNQVKMEQERERLIAELQEALVQVKTLGGLLPICACCKKIRNDDGYWQQVEVYLSAHSGARLTHSFCPECYEKTLSEIDEAPTVE